MTKNTQSRTRNESSRFHTHPDTSVAIMAVRLSLNISHFYNTERGNTVDPNCFPWTDRQEQVASHETDQVTGRDVEVTSLGILSVLNSLDGNMTYD